MQKTSRHLLFSLAGLLMAGLWQPAQAATQHVIIENGNSALSKEAARQSSEQWNDTRNLRRKVNSRAEKEFDKVERAIDGEEKCNASSNFNAYWEAKTSRCLDRRTGRPAMP
ncbi:DUF1283 family protein [Musicola paradisiaca]|uniref:UPF0482 protein Dd703_1894 n=1 Tax=Musicola paradisiaca (strain Ech703) TaxID=579405 RepID=C6C575_MUSP7|nr:DUF1283 family protein [Musicola paradisiaca]ACS85685.1 conserved hypothetical protein [Musicola paradisiaca Ech703]